jgi:hypothetical protein
VLATDLVQTFSIRRQDHTFHLGDFAETLELLLVYWEELERKFAYLSSFLYTLRERQCFTFDSRSRGKFLGKG